MNTNKWEYALLVKGGGTACGGRIQNIKRILSLILSLAMLFSLTAGLDLSAYAQTYSGTCGDNVKWTLDTDTRTLTISGSGRMTDYMCNGDVPWYSQRADIKIVDIKSGVTSIGDDAFFGCNSLTRIAIPNSITNIGEWAFNGCENLTSIIIPNSITSIGYCAFQSAGLINITIPDSVKDIASSAFSNCRKLKYINVDNKNEYYSSEDGVVFNKDKTHILDTLLGKQKYRIIFQIV